MGKIVIDGVELDEINKEEMREKLLNNIALIKEFNPEFNMTNEEIEEQLSDENIQRTYKIRAAAKKNAGFGDDLSLKQGNPNKISDEFTKRMKTKFRQFHPEEGNRYTLFNEPTVEGEQFRKEQTAKAYNRVIALDGSVFDFQNNLFKKENLLSHKEISAPDQTCFNVSKEKFNKALDYAIEHREDLEIAMIIGNSMNAVTYRGYDVDSAHKFNDENVKNVGEIIGGRARLLYELYNRFDALTFPFKNVSIGQIKKTLEGAGNKYGQQTVAKVAEQFARIQVFLSFEGYLSSGIERPANLEYTADSFVYIRPKLLDMKLNLEKTHEKFLILKDDSEICKSAEYNKLLETGEKVLNHFAGLKGEVSEAESNQFLQEMTEYGNSIRALETKIRSLNNIEANIKAEIKDLISEASKEAKYGISLSSMSIMLDEWNKVESKDFSKVLQMRNRRDDTLNVANAIGQGSKVSSEEFTRIQSVSTASKRLAWERRTSEKDFSAIESVEQAGAVLQYLSSQLDTTSKDSNEYKEFKTLLDNSLNEYAAKATNGEKKAYLESIAPQLSQAAANYLLGKGDRLQSYGLHERSLKRYETIADLAKLSSKVSEGTLRTESRRKDDSYKERTLDALRELEQELKDVSVSGDSKEFKRMQERLHYVTSMVEASNGKIEIMPLLHSLRADAADYYVNKIDASMHGTRADKIEAARKILYLTENVGDPIVSENPSAAEVSLMGAIRLTKEIYRLSAKSKDPKIKAEARDALKNPQVLLKKAKELQVSKVYQNATRKLDSAAIKKLSGKDLYKLYHAKLPDTSIERPLDVKMKKVMQTLKDGSYKFPSNPFITKEEKQSLSTNKHGFTVARTMVETLSICMLLNEGMSYEDALNPDKFKKEKRQAGLRSMNLIKGSTEKDDVCGKEIRDIFIKGGKKIISETYALMDKIPALTFENIATPNGALFMKSGTLLKDVIQEIHRSAGKTEESENLSLEADAINKYCSATLDYFDSMKKAYSRNTKDLAQNELVLTTSLYITRMDQLYQKSKNEAKQTGKTVASVLMEKDPERGLIGSMIGEITNLNSGIARSLRNSVRNVVEEMNNDMSLGDKFIEASFNGAFKKVDIQLNKQTMDYTFTGLDKLENDVKAGLYEEKTVEQKGIKEQKITDPKKENLLIK